MSTTLRIAMLILAFSPCFVVVSTHACSGSIDRSSAQIVGWASAVHAYQQGPQVLPVWSDQSATLGPAQGVNSTDAIYSLGRGGTITLEFSPPIIDGEGCDFAIFENAFFSGNAMFLELAWVEVSSDGANFVRFPSYSLTAAPVGQFETINPAEVVGYASLHVQGQGTLFDLAALGTKAPLEPVRFVRIVDIVGDGSASDLLPTGFALPIYDPHPTVMTAGFDLDGVGVLNQAIADEEIAEPVPVPLPVPMLVLLSGVLTALGSNYSKVNRRKK